MVLVNTEPPKANRIRLCPFLWAREHLMPFPTRLCGHIVLVSRFLLQVCPQMSEDEDDAMRTSTLNQTLRWTLFPIYHVTGCTSSELHAAL